MKLILLLVIVAMSISQAFGIKLKCIFANTAKGYGCITTDVFKKDAGISSIIGQHASNLNSSELTYFEIPESSTSNYVPINVCEHFPELLKIFIYGKKIKAIGRQVFKGCEHVNTLFISDTTINWLPEDSFVDLHNLEHLYLSNNQLKVLPANLMEINFKLKIFWANGNELEVIELQFGDSVTSVDLDNNICVKERASGLIDVAKLNKIIDESCATSKQKASKLEMEKLRKAIDESSEKLAENLELHENIKMLNETIFEMEKDNEELREEINEKAQEIEQEIEKLNLELSSVKGELEESFSTISNLTEMLIDFETETDDYTAEVVKEKVWCSEQLKDFQQFNDKINETVNAQKAFIDELLTSATIVNQTLYEKDAIITNLTSLNDHLNDSIRNFDDEVELDELKSNLSLCVEQVRRLNAVTVINDSTTDDDRDSTVDVFPSGNYVINKVAIDEIEPTSGHHLDEMRLLLGKGDGSENLLGKAQKGMTTDEATTEYYDNLTEAMPTTTNDLTNYEEEYDDEGDTKTTFKECFVEGSVFSLTTSDDFVKNEESSSQTTTFVQSDENPGSSNESRNRNLCNNLSLAEARRLTEEIANLSKNLSATVDLNQNLTSEVFLLNRMVNETYQGKFEPSTLARNSTKLGSKIIQLEKEADDSRRLVYLLCALLLISILFCILLIVKLCVKPQRVIQVSGIEMNHGSQGRISMTTKV